MGGDFIFFVSNTELKRHDLGLELQSDIFIARIVIHVYNFVEDTDEEGPKKSPEFYCNLATMENVRIPPLGCVTRTYGESLG